jgi:hypothetical protein
MKKGLILLFLLAGCDQGVEWNGWVYPNGGDLTRDVPIGKFSSLEECRTSARTLLANFNIYDGEEKIEGDYECGFKCKPDTEMGGINVCEKTEH